MEQLEETSYAAVGAFKLKGVSPLAEHEENLAESAHKRHVHVLYYGVKNVDKFSVCVYSPRSGLFSSTRVYHSTPLVLLL